MNKAVFQYLWVRIVGIVMIMTGIVHTAATPMAYHKWIEILPQDIDRVWGVVFFFAISGVAVIFAGILMIYSSFGLKKKEKWAKFISLIASLFIVLFGIGAIVAGMTNPLIWLMIFGGVSNAILLAINRTEQ